jgi:hypothetical protein
LKFSLQVSSTVLALQSLNQIAKRLSFLLLTSLNHHSSLIYRHMYSPYCFQLVIIILNLFSFQFWRYNENQHYRTTQEAIYVLGRIKILCERSWQVCRNILSYPLVYDDYFYYTLHWNHFKNRLPRNPKDFSIMILGKLEIFFPNNTLIFDRRTHNLFGHLRASYKYTWTDLYIDVDHNFYQKTLYIMYDMMRYFC